MEEQAIVWTGEWMSSDDGQYETRPSVAQNSAGFLPRLEVSRSGGDCDPEYHSPMPTLEQGIKVAKELNCDWHRLDMSDTQLTA